MASFSDLETSLTRTHDPLQQEDGTSLYWHCSLDITSLFSRKATTVYVFSAPLNSRRTPNDNDKNNLFTGGKSNAVIDLKQDNPEEMHKSAFSCCIP